MEQKHCVYVMTNLITKRRYVGRDCHHGLRFRQHRNALIGRYHTNELMQEDFEKYGFVFIVDFFDDLEYFEAKYTEAYLMKVLRTKDKRFGYNYKDSTGDGEGHIFNYQRE
jgi:hypothetical protein